ncbi:hypothetical protein C2G38_2046717 [Gigaspora rosea]|uniref:Uncharacterized protein n=1 Tax=Gigaspora rosea TaxID=44941 RepID=A0A397U8A7_9GLOM|nr:hypothetical protein C2G38_2046717 [Gigaspora rosea]
MPFLSFAKDFFKSVAALALLDFEDVLGLPEEGAFFPTSGNFIVFGPFGWDVADGAANDFRFGSNSWEVGKCGNGGCFGICKITITCWWRPKRWNSSGDGSLR